MNHPFSTNDNKYVFRVFLTYAGDFLKTCEKFGFCSRDTTYFCEAGAVLILITKRICSCKALMTIILVLTNSTEQSPS
jgi:hypothetical protein